jgi:hypothetical protein
MAMKIKTAFALSIVINAVLLTAVAYMALISVPLRNEPIIIINRTVPSAQSKGDSTPRPDIAGLPN